MSKPRRASTLLRYCLALLALLAASLSGGVLNLGGFGAASAGALYTVPTTSVMIPPGGSATLQVRGMSLQPGSTISGAPAGVAAQAVPPDNVRTTLYYGINWGYTETDPQQAVLAVWYAQDGTWHGDKHDTAEQIHSAAASSPGVPGWSPNGRSALQLAGSGQVRIGEVALAPTSQSPSVGSGTLALTNTSDQELLVYLPYGTIFGSGPSSVLVWAVGEVIQDQPSPTAEETLPQPTDTPNVPESTPTEEAATATATATTAAATPAAKKSQATATSSAVPGQEASPTEQPPPVKKGGTTATATATLVPTDTATQEPTATATATIQPTTPAEPAKPAAPNARPPAHQPASAPVPRDNAAQSPASNNATNAAPSENKPPTGKQNSVQPPAAGNDTGANTGAEADTQAPAPGKDQGTTSEQEAPAKAREAAQGRKIEALAPAVTITTAPRPIETAGGAAGDRAAVPPAVQTSGATPPPPPVQTGNPTSPGSTGVPTRPAAGRTGTPTSPPTGTATARADVPVRETPQPTGTSEPVPTGEAATPTAEPTQDLQPAPTRLTDVEPTPTPAVPVIVTDPGGAGGDQGGVAVGSDGGDAGGGTTPSVNPRTGGGPSPLPLVLSISSVMLVLSGWQLRRLAARQTRR